MPKKYDVSWALAAEKDLLEIGAYIAAENASAARQFMKTIEAKARSLETLPNRGRIVPELREFGISAYRELLVKTWRIIYRVDNNAVYVLGIFDGRRHLEDILLERLLRS